jgi:flagellar export protein FliJ
MNRFKWPLQRLLELKAHKEENLKAELQKLIRDIALARREIRRRRDSLRRMADELGREEFPRRLPQQRILLSQLPVAMAAIEDLEAALAVFQERRAGKMTEYLRERASRQTLEKLREKSLRRFLKLQESAEQKELDEVGSGAYARGMPGTGDKQREAQT